MKNPSYCKNLVQAYLKIIQDRKNLSSAAEKNGLADIQQSWDIYKSAFNAEKNFFEETGYLYHEVAKNIVRMEVFDFLFLNAAYDYYYLCFNRTCKFTFSFLINHQSM